MKWPLAQAARCRSFARSASTSGGVGVLCSFDLEYPPTRVFISHRPRARLQVTTARPRTARRQPPRSPPKARMTAATPKSAPLLCSARRWRWIPIRRVAMVLPRRSRNRQGERAPSRYPCPSPLSNTAGETVASLHDFLRLDLSAKPRQRLGCAGERAALAAPQTRRPLRQEVRRLSR